MQPSKFNVRVPLRDRNEVFLMNTLTDAQLIVPTEVAEMLDGIETAGGTEALGGFDDDERETLELLGEHGFLVESHAAERASLERFFDDVRTDRRELRITVLTTLQCNFACDYCFQGDHGDAHTVAEKMSLETSERVGRWVVDKIDEVRPGRLALTFFGGEPLLNQPVMFALADQLWRECQKRDLDMYIDVITNGLLLTPEVVARLKQYGLNGIKITLDGDRDTHDRMRPMRGGQPTFDRIIENVRRIAGECPISIGGNFDASSVDSYPALLDFLKAQDFADKLVKVSFKPIIDTGPAAAAPAAASGVIPLTAVDADSKPLGGTCMSSAGSGGGTGQSTLGGTPCDTCHFVEEKSAFLREETERRGFATADGVHMGPCEIHQGHAHTIGPDGSLYACPGFTGEPSLSTGHIDNRVEARRQEAARRFDRLAPWRACGDCSFIPVCAGGCSVASHAELGDMDAPTCHKNGFETALVAFAEKAASGRKENHA